MELSIVLVILGLLTGGILAGQSLIRAAELRAVASEYQRYTTALASFRDQYMALPGDMRSATDFWGAVDGNDGMGADCFYAASSSALTCNGNGDGNIVDHSSTAGGAEMYRFWQHLANAGLIEGNYTGAPRVNPVTTNDRYATRGVNLPASKLGQAAWYAAPNSTHDGTGWAWAGTYTFPFIFGAVEPTDITEVPVLKPEEAWNIDQKLDDGKPAYGKVRSARASTACNTTQVAGTAEYAVTTNSITCYLLFTQ